MKLLPLIIIFVALISQALASDCIAHRGFTTESKDNTIESIREAWKFEATIVEVDLHVLRDGSLVLFHDNEVDGRPLASLNYAELQAMVGAYHVPTLQEAFMAVPAGKSIILDLKSNSKELFTALERVVNEQAFDFTVIIQSPNLAFLSYLVPRFSSDFEYHYLSKLERSGLLQEAPSAAALVASLKNSGITGVSVKGRRFIDQEFVDTIQSHGFRFFVWTINDPVRIRFYTSLGVDGIITDNPEATKQIKLEEANQAQ